MEFILKILKKKKSYFCFVFKKFINEEIIKVYLSSTINDVFSINNEILVHIECCIIVPEFVFNYFTNKAENELVKNDDEFFNQIESEDHCDYMIYKNHDKFGSSNIENIEIINEYNNSNNHDNKEEIKLKIRNLILIINI